MSSLLCALALFLMVAQDSVLAADRLTADGVMDCCGRCTGT